MCEPLDDPRLTGAAQRWSIGPHTERVERETRQLLAQVQNCPVDANEGELCACGKAIRSRLQRAYDQPAPPLGSTADRVPLPPDQHQRLMGLLSKHALHKIGAPTVVEKLETEILPAIMTPADPATERERSDADE